MIPGFTSTGSKRPSVLYGHLPGGPVRMVRSNGAHLWDEDGNEFLDMGMALGAVGLGYAHPAVTRAVTAAAADGVVGSLAPVLEEELAAELVSTMPGAEALLFLKTGAEAVSAAVRIARVYTGREAIVVTGYHGWLDTFQREPGVPGRVVELTRRIAFNDCAGVADQVDSTVAAVVVEPVVEREPDTAWLGALKERCNETGSVLIFDEIKTAFRIALGGAAEKYGVIPDLMTLGKAMGNGFPIAAVAGNRDVMDAACGTWISSTLATEFVSLAAARAVLDVYRSEDVISHMESSGSIFFGRLRSLAARYSNVITGLRGIPQMCFLDFGDEHTAAEVAVRAARRGLLFKRTAYNFVSHAHSEQVVGQACALLEETLEEVDRTC